MKLKKIICMYLVIILVLSNFSFLQAHAKETISTKESEVFYDDFSGNILDTDLEKKKLAFEVDLKTDKEKISKGDTFTITAAIDKIAKNKSNGLMAIEGKLEYDTDVLEIDLDSIQGQNSWNLSKDYYNQKNFKFITDSNGYIDKPGDIFKVSFKVKENIEDTIDTMIKMYSIKGGTGEIEGGIVFADDAEIRINIEEQLLEKITSETYIIGDRYISKVLPNTTVKKFISNVEINGDYMFIDINENILTEDDLIKTGTKLKIGNTLEYQLVVNGDIDGNGMIDVNDLAMLKLHCIGLNTLTGVSLEAAEIDGLDKVNTSDIATLKLILIE